MKIEDKLKELILSRYKSLREFSQVIDMPYSTLDTILKRGIDKASIGNIIKICQELHISADELANNRIVPSFETTPDPRDNDIENLINDFKSRILTYDDLTCDGSPVDPITRLALVDAIDTAVEVGKRKTTDSKFLQMYAEYLKKVNEKK